ncbi:hypothetical protein PybrP1_011183 [[Pythium] brassicae (nom. inval.)]|nr:hypothetical protein PybrP1_011183 [[Pythium] brassicae (nom. inval.)]
MTWLAWGLSVLIVALALLYASPKLRKATFIWCTYISLTGWYYFRLWEKRRARNSGGGAMSPTAKAKAKSGSGSGSARPAPRHGHGAAADDDADVEDVVYFESAEKLLQQRELRNVSERSARLSGSSSSGNSLSGYSDDSLGRFSTGQPKPKQQPKTHLGIFRGLRKSKAERSSDVSNADSLARSSVSEPGSTTRRTYTGRKKPQSWGD